VRARLGRGLHSRAWARWREGLDGGGFSVGGGVDMCNEAVAGGGDGFDEARLTGIVVESFAEEADGAGEGALGNSGIGPDSVEDLLLADEAAAVLDEVEQQAEGLGLEGDGYAVRKEAEGGVVGLEAIEAEDQRGAPCAARSGEFLASIMDGARTFEKNRGSMRVPSGRKEGAGSIVRVGGKCYAMEWMDCDGLRGAGILRGGCW
jgi:hypothetical protein